MANKPTYLRSLKLNELSLVDRPANPGAHVTIFKRDNTPMKTEGGKQYPASDYAYVPDASKPSTWKLRLTSTPGGEPDPGIVGAAAAALGPGYRGQKVDIPAADRAKVVARVRAAWKEANPDKSEDEMPSGIKKAHGFADHVATEDFLNDGAVKALDIEQEATNQLEAADMPVGNNSIGKKEKTMSDVNKQVGELQQQIIDLTKQLGDVTKRAERAEAAVAKAQHDSDEIVMVGKSEIRKSVIGEDAFAVIKSQQDEIAKSKEAVEIAKAEERVEKEFPNLPGDKTAKAKAFMAIGKFDDFTKQAVESMLSAGNKALGDAMIVIGKDGSGSVSDSSGSNAERKIMAKAQEIQKRDGVSHTVAYSTALTENPELYNEFLSEKAA